MLDFLGGFLRDRGMLADARTHFDQALAIHRAAGNSSEEGALLGSLGDLLARQGDFAKARDALELGAARLRDAGDELGLAKLHCKRGHAEIAADDPAAAHLALAAADAVARSIGATGDSEIARNIQALRDALKGAES